MQLYCVGQLSYYCYCSVNVNIMLGYAYIESMTNYCLISRICIVGLLRVGMR